MDIGSYENQSVKRILMPHLLTINCHFENIVLLQSFALSIKIMKIGFGFSQRNVYSGPHSDFYLLRNYSND